MTINIFMAILAMPKIWRSSKEWQNLLWIGCIAIIAMLVEGHQLKWRFNKTKNLLLTISCLLADMIFVKSFTPAEIQKIPKNSQWNVEFYPNWNNFTLALLVMLVTNITSACWLCWMNLYFYGRCWNVIASCCNLLGFKWGSEFCFVFGGRFDINQPSTIIAVEILRFTSRKLILWEQPFLHVSSVGGFRCQNICVFIHFLKLVKPVWQDLGDGSAEFCNNKKSSASSTDLCLTYKVWA